MKRISILSVLITLSTLAGFLFLFPLEWVLLLITLVALMTVQVIVVRRHLHVVGNSASRRQSAVGMGKVARESRAPQLSAATPAADSAPLADSAPAADSTPVAEFAAAGGTAPEIGEGHPIDPALFSKFRAHLDAAERGGDEQPPAAGTGTTELPETEPAGRERPGGAGGPSTASVDRDTTGDGDVRVVISPAARRKAASTGKTNEDQTAPRQQNSGAGEKDLFADLRTELLKSQPLNTQPLHGGAIGGEPAAKSRKGKAAAKANGGQANSGASADSANKAAPSASGDTGELEMLLKLAEAALEKKDRAGAAASLEQVLRLHGEAEGPMPWRMRLAQARLAVLEGNHEQAVGDFEELLKWHPRFEETEYVGQIDQLTSPVSGASGAELRVSMLLKLLAVFRQASDRMAMDRIYVLIEKAQEQSGDEMRLIQYYKNHLEIKTVLEDVEGQLDLIDQIGNRYYKLGDTEAARKFYEQGLKLREAQEAAAGEAGTASP